MCIRDSIHPRSVKLGQFINKFRVNSKRTKFFLRTYNGYMTAIARVKRKRHTVITPVSYTHLDEVISRIIYTLVALAAVWCISLLFKQNEILSSENGEKRE